MSRSNPTRVIVATLIAFAVVLSTESVARAQASRTCAAKCIPIYEKHMTALLNCATKALKLGVIGDPQCPKKARDKVFNNWNKVRVECGGSSCNLAYPTASTACTNRLGTINNVEDEQRLFGDDAVPPFTSPIGAIQNVVLVGCNFAA